MDEMKKGITKARPWWHLHNISMQLHLPLEETLDFLKAGNY